MPPRSARSSYGKVAAAAAKLTPPDPKEHQAQGSEELEDRRQAAEAARHRRQAQRREGLRHRREAARHAQRRHQGCAGVRLQGGELRRRQGRAKMPGVKKVMKVKRHRRRGRRRHLVARQDRARRAADHLGRRRQRQGLERDHRASTSRTVSPPAENNGERRNGDALGGDRGRGEEGRGDLLDAVPLACLHGDDERDREALGRQGGVLGADAEPRGLARGAVGSLRHAARAMRGAPARPRRRLRPARRHAGLRASGGRDREGIPRHAGQADLEPRGRPGARFLPPDLDVQDVGRPRREGRAGRPARAVVRPVDQRLAQSDRHRRTARTAASCRAGGRSRTTRSSATRCRTC